MALVTHKTKNGFTLIEVAVASALAAFVGLLAMYFMTGTKKESIQFVRRAAIDTEAPQFTQLLLTAARLALSCRKVVVSSPASVSLQCTISRTAGISTEVRFIKIATENLLRYQEDRAGTWKDISVLGDDKNFRVSSFILCDSTDMQVGALTCPLLPTQISTQQAFIITQHQNANPIVDMTSRFFRFAVTIQHFEKGRGLIRGS